MRHKIAVLMLGALVMAGCAAQAQKPAVKTIDQQQIELGVVPCDTDADCEAKNPAKAKAVYLCDAFTKEGKRCRRHVREDGLMCWQHSAARKADPEGYDAAQANRLCTAIRRAIGFSYPKSELSF